MAVKTNRNITNFILSQKSPLSTSKFYVYLWLKTANYGVVVTQSNIYKQKFLVSSFIHHAWACCNKSQIKTDVCTIGPYHIYMKMPSSFPFYFFLFYFFMLARHEIGHVCVLVLYYSKNLSHVKDWKHDAIPGVIHSSITWKRLHFMCIIFFVQLH